ncbi:hypothetical protein [Marinomonas transparens]|uniref:Phage Tail Collar Domain protein n=1 Tax=Marinomonas transparens TaxID=2795388 RepID=A0A934JTM7_9GAMM|nr:hypothetical protein [Marinomonas transparens]MBJ7537155.1 hypothetical protein [Marinomonas transparens]
MNYPDRDDLFLGKFTDGDPLTDVDSSVASSADMNALYDELIYLIQQGGLTPEVESYNQIAQSVENQIRAASPSVPVTSGSADAIILTTPVGKQPVIELQNYDQVRFVVAANNTADVTIAIDGLPVVNLSLAGIADQLLKGALATITYINGRFHLTQQINPQTGNDVKDIAKVITDSLDRVENGEIAFDGATLKRADHPVFWSKVQTSSNLIDQATKDAEAETYAGFYGTGDGSTTFTIPTLGGEFIRGYDNGRGVDAGREFGSHQMGSIVYQPGYIGGVTTRSPSSGYFDGHRIFGDTYDDGFQPNIAQGTDIQGYGIKAPSYPQPYANYDGVATSGNTYNVYKGTRPRNIAYFFKTRV